MPHNEYTFIKPFQCSTKTDFRVVETVPELRLDIERGQGWFWPSEGDKKSIIPVPGPLLQPPFACCRIKYVIAALARTELATSKHELENSFQITKQAARQAATANTRCRRDSCVAQTNVCRYLFPSNIPKKSYKCTKIRGETYAKIRQNESVKAISDTTILDIKTHEQNRYQQVRLIRAHLAFDL